ncbi:MAG: hypothetical protein M3R55_12350 [Acidobacteriota bacterium]|nr:hypothetical protein [Acidobacteriota bacterium]
MTSSRHALSSRLFLAALALLLWAFPVSAQSPLGEAARREADRRKISRPADGKTYTNADLARLPVRATPVRPRLPALDSTTAGTIGAPAEPPVASPAAAPATDAAPAARDEKWWHDRITAVRTNLSRAQIFAESLDTRINSLSNDFISRDDPAQRAQIFEQRERALQELTRVKGEIDAFTRQIGGIEEEARRLGVPPGWLR